MKEHFDPAILLPIISKDLESKGGEFTIVSKSTGKDFTFKIGKSEFKNRFYVHVSVEVGYRDYKYLGVFKNGKIIKKGEEVNTPASDGAAWLLRQVQRQDFQKIKDNVELLHLGHCLKCGKELTDSLSIEYGLGPTCRHQLGI